MHRITIPIRIQSMSIIQHSPIIQLQLLAVLSMGLLMFGWTIQYNVPTRAQQIGLLGIYQFVTKTKGTWYQDTPLGLCSLIMHTTEQMDITHNITVTYKLIN